MAAPALGTDGVQRLVIDAGNTGYAPSRVSSQLAAGSAVTWDSPMAPVRLSASMAVGQCVPLVAFPAVYAFEPTSDAALLFFGG